MRLVFVLFVFLLTALAVNAYTERSFSMDVQLQPDGGAHVIEKSYFILDNKNEVDAFEFVRREGKTTLTDWQKFSRNVRYHVLSGVLNLRIVAAREFQLGFTTASITLEYDVNGMTTLNKTTSRRTHYQLRMEKLLLDSSPGELNLGNNFALNVYVPTDAVNLKVYPDAGVFKSADKLQWVGPTSGKWDASFDREITLAKEVQLFFLELYGLLLSTYLLWLLGAVVLGIAAYKVFTTRRQ